MWPPKTVYCSKHQTYNSSLGVHDTFFILSKRTRTVSRGGPQHYCLPARVIARVAQPACCTKGCAYHRTSVRIAGDAGACSAPVATQVVPVVLTQSRRSRGAGADAVGSALRGLPGTQQKGLQQGTRTHSLSKALGRQGRAHNQQQKWLWGNSRSGTLASANMTPPSLQAEREQRGSALSSLGD
ncbi:hypothetical protein HPB48_020361 [Haemaphysalis longicornis]|uniref:Uncharacterized protein n=1 Tax=Haemaphysalis longicornis TaxID=44386 RepID=A0A9J6GJ36_HAELO|nr:hypothetical protein HPB48_020361 [Haemaphysalis longicornis]